MTAALGLALALMAGAAQAETVKLSDELTIYYEKAGNGPTTILFVPGWAMSTEVFEHQLAAFENSKEFTFVTYDPRGQGRSSKTEHGHFYQQHGRDLNDLIKALKLDNIVLAGWSYGGLEALAYVNEFGTERLKGFVLIDATPKSRGADNTKEWVWYSYEDKDGFEAFFTMGPLLNRVETIKEFAAFMFADKSEKNIAWAASIAEKTNSTTMALLNAAGAHDDFTNDLISMDGHVPLLYIVNEGWGPVVSAWSKANTPSAKVSAILPSHIGFWEKPKMFNAEIMSFLNALK